MAPQCVPRHPTSTRCNNIRSVVLTGVITQGCVNPARDAMFHDYYTVVMEDACDPAAI